MPRIQTNRVVQISKRSKYGNRKVAADGFTFDSIKEYNRYIELKYLFHTGKIKDLELQKSFVLQESFIDMHGKRQRPIYYKADFYYYDIEKQEWVIEDVKSEATKKDKVYALKKKMMLYNGYEIKEI